MKIKSTNPILLASISVSIAGALLYAALVAWPRIHSDTGPDQEASVSGLVFFDTNTPPEPVVATPLPLTRAPSKPSEPVKRPSVWIWFSSLNKLRETPRLRLPFVETLPQFIALTERLLPKDYSGSFLIFGDSIDESLMLAAKVSGTAPWRQLDATWSVISLGESDLSQQWDASVIASLDKARLGGHAECWIRGDMLASAPGNLSLQSVGISAHFDRQTTVRIVAVPTGDTPMQNWLKEAHDRPRSIGQAEPEMLSLPPEATWRAAVSLPSPASLIDFANWTRKMFPSSPLPGQAAPSLEMIALCWTGHLQAVAYPENKWLVQLQGSFPPDKYDRMVGVAAFWGYAAQQEILWKTGTEMKTSIGWNREGVVLGTHPTASVALTVFKDEHPFFQNRVHLQTTDNGFLQIASGLDVLVQHKAALSNVGANINDISLGAALLTWRSASHLLVIRPALTGQTPYLDIIWTEEASPQTE